MPCILTSKHQPRSPVNRRHESSRSSAKLPPVHATADRNTCSSCSTCQWPCCRHSLQQLLQDSNTPTSKRQPCSPAKLLYMSSRSSAKPATHSPPTLALSSSTTLASSELSGGSSASSSDSRSSATCFGRSQPMPQHKSTSANGEAAVLRVSLFAARPPAAVGAAGAAAVNTNDSGRGLHVGSCSSSSDSCSSVTCSSA